MNEPRRLRARRTAAAAVLVACVALGIAGLAAGRIAGGPGARGDCFAEFDNLTSTRPTGPPRVDCVDGDPACDTDGDCHNGRCTFAVGVCINQTDVADCTPPPGGLKRIRALPSRYAGLVDGLDLQRSTCTAPGAVVVKTRRKGKRPGKQRLRLVARAPKGTKPVVDSDAVTLVCIPRPAAAPCPTTTTTIATTTTTTTTICPAASCGCAGGVPRTLEITTTSGSGECGHLDSSSPDFFALKCGALYLGGAGVLLPVPPRVPDETTSTASVCCNGSTLTLRATSAAEAGTNACTASGCTFGAPVPIPNGAHGQTGTSACLVNTLARDVAGTFDCATGSTSDLTYALAAAFHLTGDLLPKRCTGGSRPGAACTADGDCGGGTCANDTGRCADLFDMGGTNAGAACTQDGDCTGGATCEAGACEGGAKAGQGCVTDADCPGGGACGTLVQPCPICDGTCHGGPNDGLACVPGSSAAGGASPTSADCPPPLAAKLDPVAITFVLGTGTVTKTAAENPGSVFCGFCRTNALVFKQPAVACDPSHRTCVDDASTPCTTSAQCPGIHGCDGNTDCRAVAGGFTTCGQRTSGAFTGTDVATTIVEVGTPAGGLTVGGPPKPATLASVFCIPPTFDASFDAAADLAGPGGVALPVEFRLK